MKDQDQPGHGTDWRTDWRYDALKKPISFRRGLVLILAVFAVPLAVLLKACGSN